MLKGGLHVSPDGCIHCTFKHDPSTLRLSSAGPNMQNLPRTGPTRSMFVAPPGYTFWAVDYAGIEAILVGYFAKSARYIRLAKLDIHSFYTAYALYELEKAIPAADLPSESWADNQLADCLSGLKRRFAARRTANKPLVHGGNYLMGPFEAQETILKDQHKVIPIKDIKRLQAFYWELFPEIPQWHQKVTGLAFGDTLPPDVTEQEGAYQRGWLRTPFGNIHRYFDVLEHKKGPQGWRLQYASDAKRAVAFLPQSSARMVLTRAAQRMAPDVQETFRLFVHDEILAMCQLDQLEHCLAIAKEEMERPVPELGGLVLPTEAKAGTVWGEMK